MGRKSIFRFSLRTPAPPSKPETTPTAVNNNSEVSLPSSDPEARYIPRQWAPNRFQTLYVTPSEQDLYLAAMAQLDRAPPPLPLWTDPAPVLPPVHHQPAMDTTPPLVLSPPRGAPLRLPPAGMASKFVMSPGMPSQGLSVRDEFRTLPAASGSGATTKEHALLALSDDAQLRFHNFPVDVLLAVQEALRDAWPKGRRSAHPDLKELAQKSQAKQDGSTWIVVLKGNVWRQSGKSELELILALLTVLSIHGWVLVDRVQAAGISYDNHNLLFAYSDQVKAIPPTYFAVSIPLPDRISLISPPPKATPTIISAVREAIESQTAINKRRKRRGAPKGGERSSIISAGRPASSVEWDSWKGNIRLEGWVHQGVYRFWLGGMRRWLGNGVKWRVVENLILTLINALSAQHFTLLTSLPLLPLVKGRDILIFASQQSSGLTYRDTWRPQPSASDDPSRPESIVMITTEDARLQRGEVIPDEMARIVQAEQAVAARQEAAGAMAVERRLAAEARTSPVRTRHQSLQPPPRVSPPTRQVEVPPHLQQRGLRRNASTGSNNPLIPANISLPRQRNILTKKPSLKRDASGTGLTPPRSSSLRRQEAPSSHQRFASLDERRQPGEAQLDKVHITSRHGIGSEHSGMEPEWTMIDVQPQQTGLGLSMYAPTLSPLAMGTAQPSAMLSKGEGTARTPAWNELEAPMPPPLPPRVNHTEPAAPPLPARPTQPYTSFQPVITPINPITHQPYPPAHRTRPSIESDRSIYVDAPSAPPQFSTPARGHDLPPNSFTPSTPQTPTFETPFRDLKIANPTPPPPLPTSTTPLSHQALASLDMTLSQPTSPLKGRDAMVDVGQGTGLESARGSVGYLPSLASQSVLGLTPAMSEGPILGAWDEAKSRTGNGNVPMPMAAAYGGEMEHLGSEKGQGKRRDSVRNMFGSARTKVSIGG